MIYSKRTARVLGAFAAVSVLSVAPGVTTYAQQVAGQLDDPDEIAIEEIVTTGSRIRRDDFSSSSPLTVVGGQSMLDQGLSNLGDALREQASIGTGGFNQSTILSGGGASAIDLRNLGRSRVLILINGRRVASFADSLANQSADLTFVPTAMVDRVEILRDGASAVYGSDAITGVVNVILKKDFEGVEASVNTGAAAEGDGEQYGFSLTMGMSNDRGSFVAGAEWRRQDGIKQRDRDWAFPAISSLNASGAVNGSVFSPGGLFLGDGGAIWCTTATALGGDEITDVSGTDPGFCGLATRQNVSSPDQVQLARYDYSVEQDLIIESENIVLSGYGNYQLSENVNVFLESQFAKRLGTSHLDGNPGSFGTSTFQDGSRVPATNPNNPMGEDGLFLFRPTSTIGPRTSEYESNTIRIVAGIEGDLPVGNDWFYEASLLYTRVDADLTTNSVWNIARFNRISDPAQCALDPVCTAAVNPSGALDSLRPGNWTESEIAYMRQRATAISKFDTVGWQAFVSGPVVDLPAGPLNVAFGLESRRETGLNKPDSFTSGGESVANQVFPTDGSIEVDEAFLEVDVPIVNGVTAFEDLALNLQWRAFDYDSFGSDDVYRVGLNWQVTDWLRLRGNVSTAYRAPQVTDLFGGTVVSFDFFDPDICDGSASEIVPTDNAYQNCLLDGVDPATFVQPAAQYAVNSGSNPDLQPETADTMTYGLVLTPGGFLEGLQFSIDAWDIEVTDLISRNTSESVLNACYEGPVGLTAPECDRFDRNQNTGVPVNFDNNLENLSGVDTNGWDVAINYAFEAGATSWNLSLNGTYIDENTFFPFAGGADDRGSIPELQANFRTDLFLNDWTFSWLVRHISSMDDRSFDGTGTDNSFGHTGPPDYQKHDLRVSYNWERYRFMLGINNVADEDPPYIFSSGNNSDTFLYDTIGRYWFARVTFTL